MSRYFKVVTFLFALLWITTSFAQSLEGEKSRFKIAQGAEYKPGRVLVKFKSNQSESRINSILAKTGTTLKKHLRGQDVYILDFDAQTASLSKVINTFATFSSFVEYAEPDYKVKATAVPNDTYYNLQWGMPKIKAPVAWNYAKGNDDFVVAVIDTGIDYNHSDFQGKLWVNSKEIAGNGIDDDGNGYIDDVHGYNFVTGTGDPYDNDTASGGHGSHCAGTIAAATNNANGIAGLNWNGKIMALKFLDINGEGYMSDAAEALLYAVNMGARISNNSYGSSANSVTLRNAIDSANTKGHLYVASAGNEATDMDSSSSYPGSYKRANMLTVAATDQSDNLSSYSNYGTTAVHLAAPGDYIASCVRGGYAYMYGTSMAAPHVAGVAALLWSSNTALPMSHVKGYILDGVDYIPALYGYVSTGGRLNAAGSFWSALTTFNASLSGSNVSLTWTNPTHPQFQSVKIMRRSDTYPKAPTDGTQVYFSNGQSTLDTSAYSGQTSYYSAFVLYSTGAYSPGVRAAVYVPYNQSVSNLLVQYTEDAKVNLYWTNPADSAYGSTLIVRKSGSYPTSPTDGTNIYWYNGTSAQDTGVTAGQTYYYGIYCFNTSGFYGPAVNQRARPIASFKVNTFTVVPGDRVIQLNWSLTSTGKAPKQYGLYRSESAVPTRPGQGTLLASFNGSSYTDSNVSYGKTYYYSLFVQDTVDGWGPPYSVITAMNRWFNTAGDFTEAEDTTAWGFESMAGLGTAPTQWLNTYNGSSGVLKINLTSTNSGVKLTPFGRLTTQPSAWYRLRVNFLAESNTLSQEMLGVLLGYTNPAGWSIAEVSGNFNGYTLMTTNVWQTMDVYLQTKTTSIQPQLILKTVNGQGSLYIDSIVVDKMTHPASTSGTVLTYSGDSFTTSDDTTQWAFEGVAGAVGGLPTVGYVNTFSGRSGVMVLTFTEQTQGVKLTSYGMASSIAGTQAVVNYDMYFTAPLGTGSSLLGVLFGEKTPLAFPYDLGAVADMGTVTTGQWVTFSVPLDSLSGQWTLRPQLIIQNTTGLGQIYIDSASITRESSPSPVSDSLNE